MKRFFLPLAALLLISCTGNREFESYENTKWTGTYGLWPMTLYIDRVQGNRFEGEMIKPGGTITYFDGIFLDADSLVFTERYHVLGWGLTMGGTYPGKIDGDSLTGLCNFSNGPLPDSTLYSYSLARDNEFSGKSADEQVITRTFLNTKKLTEQMYSLFPPNEDPFRSNDRKKLLKYTDLIRKKWEITEAAYKSVENDSLYRKMRVQHMMNRYNIWRLVHDPVDSAWFVDSAGFYKEGDDDYYSIQLILFNMQQKIQGTYHDFLISMAQRPLSLKDRINWITNLFYAKDGNGNLEPVFLQAYADIKHDFPGNRDVILLEDMIDKAENAKRVIAGAIAPDFEVTTLDGHIFKLAECKNKYVFLDFWGIWSEPSLREIPNIKKLSNMIPESDLVVLGITRGDVEKLRKFTNTWQIHYPNAAGDETLFYKYGITRFPATFLVGPDGIIAARDLQGDQLTSQVLKIMNER
ncbi:TlpA family protein disulfide reductase [bacterium]|nr:TlpA family protein disulfide reductase [bacterium]